MPRGTDLEVCFGKYNPFNKECVDCLFRERCKEVKKYKNIRKLKY